MMTKEELEQRSIELTEFPGYTVYLADFKKYYQTFQDLTTEIENGTAVIKIDNGRRYYYSPLSIISNKVSNEVHSYITAPLGSSLCVTEQCRVPTTMLKRYKVVTSVTQDVPEYIVIPQCIFKNTRRYNVRLFINEKEQSIIAMTAPDWTADKAKGERLPAEGEYFLNCVQNSLIDVLPDIEGYVPFQSPEVYTIIDNMDDLECALINALLPVTKIVSETSLEVGENDLTYDIFKSCYLMLQSTDDQMRRSALITLGQHNCKGYFDILRWVFQLSSRIKESVSRVKAHNKPFWWLNYLVTKDRYNSLQTFTEGKSVVAGRRLIEEATDGKVHWENGNLMHASGYMLEYSLKQLCDLVI